MEPPFIATVVFHLLLVLLAGLLAGIICKRMGVSVLVGYLLIGALIGDGGLGLASATSPELRHLPEAGALLLLFSIGIELSLEELRRLSRYFFLGGSLQMVLVILPIVLAGLLLGLSWRSAVLLGGAAALSSTVLVYRALEEYGEADSPHGHRAVGILLFQDVALVPLMLLVPMLVGAASAPGLREWVLLIAHSILFVVGILVLRVIIAGWIVPLLAHLRSTELVVLFAVNTLAGASLAAYAMGLPPALGALAAGLMLSGHRLTGQIDALILPFRETFAAIFFVGLGTLMRWDALADWREAAIALTGLAALILLKTAAAAAALRWTGLRWRVALGMGLGLAQLGELSFILLSAGVAQQVISPLQYQRMLFLALGSLILTPQLLRIGLRWAGQWLDRERRPVPSFGPPSGSVEQAVVIGLGPIGAQVASQLEISGVDVCLVDRSPVNLHPFAQQGFHTIAGDALDSDVLEHADVAHCRLAIVTVPDDAVAQAIVKAIRRLNRTCTVLVRCRYQASVATLRRLGASAVITEEAEASTALLRLLAAIHDRGGDQSLPKATPSRAALSAPDVPRR